MLNEFRIKNDTQFLHSHTSGHFIISMFLHHLGKCSRFGVNNIIDGSEQFVHTLTITTLRVISCIHEQCTAEVLLGFFTLEEVLLRICTFQITEDILLQLFVLEVLIPGAIGIL